MNKFKKIKRKTMKSPWENIDTAFNPMFQEPLAVTCKRNNNTIEQTITCCVFSSTTGDPLVDESLETDRVDLDFVCKRCDWKFVHTLRRGDTLKRIGLFKKPEYVVESVIEDDVMGLVIRARSK